MGLGKIKHTASGLIKDAKEIDNFAGMSYFAENSIKLGVTGAVAGSIYGGISDNETALGGAWKGALAGTIGAAGRHGYWGMRDLAWRKGMKMADNT